MLPACDGLRVVAEGELFHQSSSHSSSPLSPGTVDPLGAALVLTTVAMVEDWPPPTGDDDDDDGVDELLPPGKATTLLLPAPTTCLALFSLSVDVAIGTLLPMSPSPDP